MRLNVTVISLLAANLLAQPSQSDKYKYAPLVATARLWNMIRYLHPRLTGDSTAWDGALLAAIPKIEAAHSDEELAVALDGMLETLHDPCTRIALGLPGKGVSVQSSDSGTMIIQPGNGDLAGTLGAGLMLKMGIPQTSILVWDLRGARMPFNFVSRPDIRQLSLNGMGYAFRQHHGYPPHEGAAMRYYYSSSEIVEPQLPPNKQDTHGRQQVYLIDKNSAVPIQAIIDQIAGRTAIISEDPPEDLQAGFTEQVNVLGKVVAEVRVADLRYPDGTTGFAPNRVVLNRADEAVKAARDIAISGEWGSIGTRPRFELRSAAFRDMPYAENPFPSREMRILAAMRIWGILHYFDSRIAAMAGKWDNTLVEMLPKFSDAKDAREYHLAAAEMIARTGDLSSMAKSTELTKYFGSTAPPFEIRLIQNQPVVTHIFKKSPVELGDVIVKIDGRPVQDRFNELSRYIAAPSPLALLNEAGQFLFNKPNLGPEGTVNVTVRGKDETERDVFIPVNTTNRTPIPAHRSGDAIRLLDEKIGYADLERLEASEADIMFEKFQHTDAIILDLRGFPRQTGPLIAARLGGHSQPVAADLFRNLVSAGSGTGHIGFLQFDLRVPRSDAAHYTGRTVALIDELSTSIAGEDALYLKAANNTVLIGSTASISLSEYSTVFEAPGGIKIFFSGQGVRLPGGKPLDIAGLKPDIEVQPTVAAIRAGRDEVLDRALQYLHGPVERDTVH